ncbi:MAG: hypothetical protein ACRCU6_10175 [Fusobacteriaceae bacterium]
MKDLGLDLDLGLNFLIILDPDSPDLYPDSFFLIESNSKGSSKILGEYKCTSNPGKSYKQKPIRFTLIKLEEDVKNSGCWQLSNNKIASLIQTGGPITIKRGKNGISETGYYGINLYGGDINSISLWSECSVIVQGFPNVKKIMDQVLSNQNKNQTDFSLFVLSPLPKDISPPQLSAE